MKEQEFETLERDVIDLCKKHNLSSASFTATASDGKGVSFFSVDNQNINGQCFEAALNVGRLWQHVRTQIKAGLDVFEKWRGHPFGSGRVAPGGDRGRPLDY